MYLRGCKYSLEKVKKKIDMWHTVRTHCPDLFDDWSYKDAKIHVGYISNDLHLKAHVQMLTDKCSQPKAYNQKPTVKSPFIGGLLAAWAYGRWLT